MDDNYNVPCYVRFFFMLQFMDVASRYGHKFAT